MSRTYSPDEMATPRDPSREPRENQRGQHRGEEGQDQGRSGGAESQPRPNETREARKTAPRTLEHRKPYEYRNRTYTLRSSEIQTMTDIGKFRAVDAKDLREFAYGADSKHLEADLTNLRRQGLIFERDIPHQETAPRQLVALTEQGHRLLVATKSAPKDQALYHGFTKPREAHHDADLYRLYQRGLEKIARVGGTNIRVILDSELKKHLYRDLARVERKGNSGDARTEVAERHGLRVVRGKIPVPDLRIEYETPDQEQTRVDLELATEHYRFRNIAQKVRAGFSIYARAQDASNLRRVLDQHELTAEILSL
jgi:DNA-binding PadR family transcriptional regulator